LNFGTNFVILKYTFPTLKQIFDITKWNLFVCGWTEAAMLENVRQHR
jgi:hypothetical protein